MSKDTIGKVNKQISFDELTLHEYCDTLAGHDPSLRKIILAHGYPPFIKRPPGFSSLVRLILEQQVSLLSAKAAYDKLAQRINEITADNILHLTDAELRECYFSRQKTTYVRVLAQAIVDGQLGIDELNFQSDDEIREKLVQLKGIGHWTVDSYLLLSLNRLDVFPVGDIALINSIRKVENLAKDFPREKILEMSSRWKPYRSIATLIFWHAYIIDKKIDIKKLH